MLTKPCFGKFNSLCLIYFFLTSFANIETNNPLADEYSGYDNITISQELASPDLELLRTVNENISAGLFNFNISFLDATFFPSVSSFIEVSIVIHFNVVREVPIHSDYISF